MMIVAILVLIVIFSPVLVWLIDEVIDLFKRIMK